MRSLGYVVQLLLILGLGALAATIWAIVLDRQDAGGLPDWTRMIPDLPSASGPAGEGGATPAVPDLPAIGRSFAAGDSMNGISAERTATGAAFTYGSGQRITVDPPEGWTLLPDHFAPDESTAGVVMLTGAGAPIVAVIAETEAEGTALLTEKLDAYRSMAAKLTREGSFGSGGGRVPVSDVRQDARGVFFCMALGAEGMQAGARLRRGLLVVVLLRPGCGGPQTGESARLDRTMAGISPDRWR